MNLSRLVGFSGQPTYNHLQIGLISSCNHKTPTGNRGYSNGRKYCLTKKTQLLKSPDRDWKITQTGGRNQSTISRFFITIRLSSRIMVEVPWLNDHPGSCKKFQETAIGDLKHE
jgi:hypothetical protein